MSIKKSFAAAAMAWGDATIVRVTWYERISRSSTGLLWSRSGVVVLSLSAAALKACMMRGVRLERLRP